MKCYKTNKKPTANITENEKNNTIFIRDLYLKHR